MKPTTEEVLAQAHVEAYLATLSGKKIGELCAIYIEEYTRMLERERDERAEAA